MQKKHKKSVRIKLIKIWNKKTHKLNLSKLKTAFKKTLLREW